MFCLFSLLWCLPLFGGTVSAKSGLGNTHTGTDQLIHSSNHQDDSALPLLALPYTTYRAHSYDAGKDIYIFRNIRYAASPIGNLRWAPPQDPLVEPGIQDGSIGGSCFQSTPHQVESSINSTAKLVACVCSAPFEFGIPTDGGLSFLGRLYARGCCSKPLNI